MFSLNKSNVTLLMSLTNMSEPELNIVTGNSHKQQGLSANHGYILKISYFAVCSLGLLINLLLLGVIIGKRAHRTPRNLFILNLAISGILTTTLCLPPTLLQCLHTGRWHLGLIACKVVPIIQGTNTLVITGTITAIAVTRWQYITKEKDYSREKIIMINMSIWLLSFVITSPILLYQRLDEIHLLGTSFTMCVEEWPNGGLRSMFTVLILCSQYILPVIVLPSFYYNILTYLQEQQEDSFGEERKLKKLTLILAFLAIIFAVSNLPLNIFFTLTELGFLFIPDVNTYYFILGVCHLLSMSSCISNPILYGYLQA